MYGNGATKRNLIPAPYESIVSASAGAGVTSVPLASANSDFQYAQRPGEKECSFFLKTGTCAYGAACRFDHPLWVPVGGLPGWREGAAAHAEEGMGPIGFVAAPTSQMISDAIFGGMPPMMLDPNSAAAASMQQQPHAQSAMAATLNQQHPERPGLPDCVHFMKTGACKFGTNCRFNHPPQVFDHMAGKAMVVNNNNSLGTIAPSMSSKGLPLRPNQPECTFYAKTGTCKFGMSCKFNHPETPGMGMISTALQIPMETFAGLSQVEQMQLRPYLQQVAALAMNHPERPGQPDCSFFLKTGTCKFGATCKFNHPAQRNAFGLPVGKNAPTVRLTPAGLPRREGETPCAFYMKTGTCRFGITCKFDHPPPAEAAAAMAALSSSPSFSPSLSASRQQQQQHANAMHADTSPPSPFPSSSPATLSAAEGVSLAPPSSHLNSNLNAGQHAQGQEFPLFPPPPLPPPPSTAVAPSPLPSSSSASPSYALAPSLPQRGQGQGSAAGEEAPLAAGGEFDGQNAGKTAAAPHQSEAL